MYSSHRGLVDKVPQACDWEIEGSNARPMWPAGEPSASFKLRIGMGKVLMLT